LRVNDPNVVTITLLNMNPDDVFGYREWRLKNIGRILGKMSVTFSVIINDDDVRAKMEKLLQKRKLDSKPRIRLPPEGSWREVAGAL